MLDKPRTLTVILRDDGPMIHCGDSPSYRSVRVLLTPEQWDIIKPQLSYTAAGHDYYEAISKCFLEAEEREVERNRDFPCQDCGRTIYVGLSDGKSHNSDGAFHNCFKTGGAE